MRRGLLVMAMMTALLSGAAHAEGDPAARLVALHDTIMDPKVMFSVSKTLAELDELEPLTARDSLERGMLENLRGVVLQKAGRQEEAEPHWQAALKVDALHPFLSPREAFFAAYEIANRAQATDDLPQAVTFYRQALHNAGTDAAVTAHERLMTMQTLAFCLHEQRQFAEARALNLEVIRLGTSEYGADATELLVPLINLAQNAYELNDHPGARMAMQRVLSIATKASDAGHVDTALFQLGVLAYEDGDSAEARRLMTQRVHLARSSADQARLRKAERDLNVLEDKINGR